jgi:hypothetical protein
MSFILWTTKPLEVPRTNYLSLYLSRARDSELALVISKRHTSCSCSNTSKQQFGFVFPPHSVSTPSSNQGKNKYQQSSWWINPNPYQREKGRTSKGFSLTKTRSSPRQGPSWPFQVFATNDSARRNPARFALHPFSIKLTSFPDGRRTRSQDHGTPRKIYSPSNIKNQSMQRFYEHSSTRRLLSIPYLKMLPYTED